MSTMTLLMSNDQ